VSYLRLRPNVATKGRAVGVGGLSPPSPRQACSARVLTGFSLALHRQGG
jgi:hypothetical protein